MTTAKPYAKQVANRPHDLTAWLHEHRFDSGNTAGERSTRAVMWITAAMMVLEIGTGWWFNSMALLADGFHMSSHVVAIGLSAFAYAAARRHANDPRFAFGSWKIEVLAGFASAIFLLAVVLLMVVGSLERLWTPEPIAYREAMAIAMMGLVVNLASALLLGQAHHGHDHAHGHDHDHAYGHDDVHALHEDLNLRSAYLHVLADAATSVLAILALLGGMWLGWAWLDPLMGLVGAVVVGMWARRLLEQTAAVLLDREMDHPVVQEIREAVEEGDPSRRTYVTDLHVWRVGKGAYSCALTVLTHDASLTPGTVRHWIGVHEEVVHSTIEVHRCSDERCTS